MPYRQDLSVGPPAAVAAAPPPLPRSLTLPANNTSELEMQPPHSSTLGDGTVGSQAAGIAQQQQLVSEAEQQQHASSGRNPRSVDILNPLYS